MEKHRRPTENSENSPLRPKLADCMHLRTPWRIRMVLEKNAKIDWGYFLMGSMAHHINSMDPMDPMGLTWLIIRVQLFTGTWFRSIQRKTLVGMVAQQLETDDLNCRIQWSSLVSFAIKMVILGGNPWNYGDYIWLFKNEDLPKKSPFLMVKHGSHALRWDHHWLPLVAIGGSWRSRCWDSHV